MAGKKSESETEAEEVPEENTEEVENVEMHDFSPIGQVMKNLLKTELLINDKERTVNRLKDELKEAKDDLKELNQDRAGYVAAMKVRKEAFQIGEEQFSLDDYLI